MKLTDAERNTILGALRLYQRQGLADNPAKRGDWLQAIVCPTDDDTSLDGKEIDELCERLNIVEDECIFLAGNLSEGHRAFGPYRDVDQAIAAHDSVEGRIMQLHPAVDPDAKKWVLTREGENQLPHTVDAEERAAYPELFRALGFQVNPDNEWATLGSYWSYSGGLGLRIFDLDDDGRRVLPNLVDGLYLQDIGCGQEPEPQGSWLELFRRLQREYSLTAPIEAFPTYSDKAIGYRDLFALAVTVGLQEYLPAERERKLWDFKVNKKVAAWLRSEQQLAAGNDIPPVPFPAIISQRYKKLGISFLTPRFSSYVEVVSSDQ